MITEYKVRQGRKDTCFKSYREEKARAVYNALVSIANFDSLYPPYYDLVRVETVTRGINDKETQKTVTITILEKTE